MLCRSHIPPRRSALAILAALAVCGSYAAPQALATDAPSPPIVLQAAAVPKSTLILVHGGGWRGPDRAAQAQIAAFPGVLLAQGGHRVVSIDYLAGKAGLQSVTEQIAGEVARRRADGGPICLYGESAGGHLALLAAARIAAVGCVVTMGSPTDFGRLRRQADERASIGDLRAQGVFTRYVLGVFGPPGSGTRAWEPAYVAERINADVLLTHQSDDPAVPAEQARDLADRSPTARTMALEPGDASDPTQAYLHSSLSVSGRSAFLRALSGAVERAIARRAGERAASARGCAGAGTAIGRTSRRRFEASLACLLRVRRPPSAARARGARSASGARIAHVRVAGRVTAAKVAAGMARSRASARALRRVTHLLGTTTRRGATSHVAVHLA